MNNFEFNVTLQAMPVDNSQDKLQWTEWTDEDLPQTTYRVDIYTLTIKQVCPCQENGYSNRVWTVERKLYDEDTSVVIATGFTLGTISAESLCEMVLNMWTKQEGHKLLGDRTTDGKPRHG